MRIKRFLAGARPDAFGGAIGQDAPALLIIFQVGNHDLVEDLLVYRRVGNRHHDLNATVQVARHHVRRADIDQGLGRWQTMAGAEAINPAVLKNAANDALDANVLGKAGDARPQAADSAHDEVDLDTGLARLIERIDDLAVDQ